MRTIPTLTKSAIKMFVRNKQSLFFTLFMPVIIMTIFGLIGFDKVTPINVGVVASNPTPATGAFVDQLKQVGAFSVTVGTEADQRAALGRGDLSVVLFIPDSLIPTPGAPVVTQTVQLLMSQNQAQQAQTAQSIISQLLDKTALSLTQAPQFFSLQTESISTRNLRYIDFLVPGVVGLAIMQMAVFSVAFVFADYKEKGILKRLIATPMRPYQFVTAQVITRLIVAIIQTATLIAIGVLIYHSHVYGSYWLVLLIALLGGIMFLGLGFTISGLAKTVEAVPAIANLVVFPMLFLGGTFFPASSMPNWLQHIVQYLPLTYFTDALRKVMTEGVGFSGISHDLIWMLGWSAILVGLANLTFGFEEKRV